MAHDDDGLWFYRARVSRIVDGDTVRFLVDNGMFVHSTQSIRVQGVDTPELFSGEDRERGRQAKTFTEGWLLTHARCAPEGDEWQFRLRTYMDRMTFNRYVSDTTCVADHDLAAAIREAGWSA